MPTVFAGWVGASRVIDYYHNPSDVLAGAALGIAVDMLTFQAYFPKQLVASRAPDQLPLRRQPWSASVDMGSLARNRSPMPVSSTSPPPMLEV